MRIQLLCDQKWRDLPNLAAMKVVLEARGHRTLISTTKDAAPMIKAFRPDCVVLNHLFAPSNRQMAAALRASGVAAVILPTEGAVRPELRPLGDGKFATDWPMDLYLAWSEPAAAGVRTRWNLDADVVPVLGCTRFDFYTEAFKATLTPRAQFCRAFALDPARPVITWATAYNYAEISRVPAVHEKFLRETAENGLAACYRRIGVDPTRIPIFHAEGRAAASAAFVALARARPLMQFIIRPHPAESRDFYHALITEHGLTNVRFCPQDYIWNVLNASDVHLHRNCTTAIEAWMWNKPTLEMGMDQVPELAWPDREAGSDMVGTADDLIATVDRYVEGGAVGQEQRSYRRRYIETWFGPADGQRCRSAAEAIDGFLAQRGRRRNAFTSIAGLPGTPRQVAAAVARYALGRRPNEALLRRVSAAVSDPHDKQVTRHDVRAYANHVRAAVS